MKLGNLQIVSRATSALQLSTGYIINVWNINSYLNIIDGLSPVLAFWI